MSMTTEGRRRNAEAARAYSAALSDQQRKERSRNAYLAGAVRTVTARIADLTPEQAADLRKALTATH